MVKIKKKPLTFKQLSRIAFDDLDKIPVCLKIAVKHGWLTSDSFFTKLTSDELSICRDLYNKTKGAKQVEVDDVELPKMVGVSVDRMKELTDRVRLQNVTGNITAMVDWTLYVTLQHRHPQSQVYFGEDNKGAIIFSEKNAVVALLYPLK